MEKLKIEERKIKQRTHEFYCDCCKKYPGYSEEYEDGYYGEIGAFEHGICLESEWYRLQLNLCTKCKDDLVTDIGNFLEKIGYKKEK